MSCPKMDDKIIKCAEASSTSVNPYIFIPTGFLDIEYKESSISLPIGEIDYSNPFISVNGAIKVGEWIFCLERNLLIPESNWIIGAFKQSSHYSFLAVDKGKDIIHSLIQYVISSMIPILHPEVVPPEEIVSCKYKLRRGT